MPSRCENKAESTQIPVQLLSKVKVKAFVMAKVFFEIVGIYYAKIWDVKNDATVGAAMDEIRSKDTSLDYKLESDINSEADRSFAWISHKVTEPLMSRTCKVRSPGIYRIDEAVMGSAVLAWQYYIERPVGPGKEKFIDLVKSGDTEEAQQLRKTIGFKRVSLTYREEFKLPDDSESLQDGDIVIWRCVTILRQGTNHQSKNENLYAMES